MSDLDPLTNDDLVVSFEAPEPKHVPGTVPAGLVLTAKRLGSGQVSIDANYVPNVDFDDAYVALSGYVGAYNPNIFAAAPDLLAALHECQSALAMLIAPEAIKATSSLGAFAACTAAEAKARAAIAKAEAE